MPLPLTNLDDRRWADLVDEGRALIPRYAPKWTDHNVHDPGITLIELFAWLTEMAIYRLNRVPPRHRRKFLAFLGFTPTPPCAARVVLAFSPDKGTASFDLPAGVVFDATGRDGQSVAFSTTRDLNVSDVALVAVQTDGGSGTIHDRTADWRDGLGVYVFGKNPVAGAVLYLGFKSLPTQQPVALAIRLASPGNDFEERSRVIREAAEQREACQPIVPDLHCAGEVLPTKLPRDLLPPHHSARVIWEVFTGAAASPWQALESIEMPARPQAGHSVDDTRSLTLDGLVEVSVPVSIVQTSLGGVGANLFYVRCRLSEGGYDAPPVLMDVAPNSVAAEQAVPISQTFMIAKGVIPQGPAPAAFPQVVCLDLQVDSQGVIVGLSFHAAGTSGKPDVNVLSYTAPTAMPGDICLELVHVGVGTGRPLPPIKLANPPVLVESVHLYTHAGTHWWEWSRRDDFDASARTELHFVLDATTGEVTFGDGERGRVPEANEIISALYRHTRSRLGNVDAKSISAAPDIQRNRALLSGLSVLQKDQLRNTPVNPTRVANRAPAAGGAAQETLAGTTGRAVETLHAHDRLIDLSTAGKTQTLDQLEKSTVRRVRPPTNAVNLLDIERLALDVPGTRVARVHACAGVHPDYPCLSAPGVVTVVVVPDMPIPRPHPTPGLLHAVKKYLDRRRVVCTRLEVVGPQYLEVHVSAWVHLEAGASATRVPAAVVDTLTGFLDPRSGGPSRVGWPFGRDVSRAEILQVIAGVRGVEYVARLSLRGGTGEALCGGLPLCPTWLVTPATLKIHAGPPPAEKLHPYPDLAPCAPLENHERIL